MYDENAGVLMILCKEKMPQPMVVACAAMLPELLVIVCAASSDESGKVANFEFGSFLGSSNFLPVGISA